MKLPGLLAAALFCLPVLLLSQSPEAPSTGVALDHIDHAVRPGDDFYRYASGAWLLRTPIPPTQMMIGGFGTVYERTNKQLVGLAQDAAAHHGAGGPETEQIGNLYRSYMDTASIEKTGLPGIQPLLDRIAGIHTEKELSRALGETLRADVDALNNTNFHTPNLFGMWVAPSFADPDHYTAYFFQGGLLLNNREYYLAETSTMQGIRAKYRAHLEAIFRLAGMSDPAGRAARVLQLETALAKVHLSQTENEDVTKANNPWSAAEFPVKAPGVDWSVYFQAAGLAAQKSFIVWEPEAVTAEAALVKATPIETWKDFLRSRLLDAYATALSAAFADESFAFYSKALAGVAEQRPREQRAAALVSASLGDAVGRAYVERYFSAADKARVEALVANLKQEYHQRLERNTWLSPSTRAEAIAKLDTLQVSVGYPETWRTYRELEIQPTDLLGNLLRLDLFDYRYQLGRLGKATDRHEWCMEPQTVNAVNLPLDNGLNFPAAMLQPPFFDPRASDAFNYGAIGAIIGHEISHTFDTQGAAFDSKGRARDWWTAADFQQFKTRAAALVAQYNAYEPFPGVHENGEQTVNENIADVAGVGDAYAAYQASLHGQTAPTVDGLTGDQQFFLAFGQAFDDKLRESLMRLQLVSDGHALSEYRADAVRNIDGWYPAFDVKRGERLYLDPTKRVRIW